MKANDFVLGLLTQSPMARWFAIPLRLIVSGSLTATWFDTARKNGSARIVGDGSNRWAMVHVQDLADLYLRAAESDAGGEVFNATDRSRSTVFECARAASFAAGAKSRVEKVSLEQARKEMGRLLQT